MILKRLFIGSNLLGYVIAIWNIIWTDRLLHIFFAEESRERMGNHFLHDQGF